MSSQVVRIEGFTKGSLNRIGKEAERGDENHRNPDINPDFINNNFFAKKTEHGFFAEWNRIKAELNAQGKETKKSIAFEGMVITSDQAFFKNTFGWQPGMGLTPEMAEFFEKSYNWAVSQIGYQGTEKNIISAVVHLDETTPHLQMYYLPVTEKWRDKVYAKDADGHVLRSATGSPIQAKDKSGKVIYKEVEDVSAPKLSRTAFWHARGGKDSYRNLQDSYHNQVGQEYGLSRGEIGSTAKHRTKAQWEQEQLQAKVKKYQDLNVSVENIDAAGVKLPGGAVLLNKTEAAILKEQSKAYVVNKEEIEVVRQRIADLNQREKDLDKRKNELEDLNQEVEYLQNLIERQQLTIGYLKNTLDDVNTKRKYLIKKLEELTPESEPVPEKRSEHIQKNFNSSRKNIKRLELETPEL